MEIHLLSFPDILPENLQSLRTSAENLGINLIEIKPAELSLLVSADSNQVFLNGARFAPQVLIHRTIAKFMGVAKPIFETLANQGTWVINDPSASIKSRSKLESAIAFKAAGLPFLDTQFFYTSEKHHLVIEEPIILKPINGVQGKGIKFFETKVAAEKWIEVQERDTGSASVEGFLAQKDLGVKVRDLRAYVVDGKCIAMMQRIPSSDNRLANMAQGGKGVALEPIGPAAKLAEDAVAALNLDFAGVDLLEIDNQIYVSELDAWAGYAGIEKVTGVSVSSAILEMIASRI